VSSVHSGAWDATHAAIVKPGTPDRFAARLGRLHMDKAELEIGFGDFEHGGVPVRLLGKVTIGLSAGAKAQIADESGIP
jgi:hypothetical protein